MQLLLSLASHFRGDHAAPFCALGAFGSRRRVWMVIGWAGGIACTVVLALIGEPSEINTGIWLGLSIATQAFLMIADVPADG